MRTYEYEDMGTWELGTKGHRDMRVSGVGTYMRSWGNEIVGTQGHWDMRTWGHENMGTQEHEDVRTWGHDRGPKDIWTGSLGCLNIINKVMPVT